MLDIEAQVRKLSLKKGDLLVLRHPASIAKDIVEEEKPRFKKFMQENYPDWRGGTLFMSDNISLERIPRAKLVKLILDAQD